MPAPVVVVRVESEFARAHPEKIDAMCDRIDSSILGEVSGRIDLGGLELVVWVEARAENEELARLLVVPRLESLLDKLGMATVTKVEIPDDAADELSKTRDDD